ncbi:hypothetical protein AM501_28050 [Aneurinibacillus migulanus]|nr:hypothetical protein TS64_20630 [Aneurinibacillus migulanus]KPD05197.1 hypothetical protein AM501_28050 [Aneurinibacillus migulanus]
MKWLVHPAEKNGARSLQKENRQRVPWYLCIKQPRKAGHKHSLSGVFRLLIVFVTPVALWRRRDEILEH